MYVISIRGEVSCFLSRLGSGVGGSCGFEPRLWDGGLACLSCWLMVRSPMADAARERLHVGAGIARRAAFHERRARERDGQAPVTSGREGAAV